jgi:hypothetical protein
VPNKPVYAHYKLERLAWDKCALAYRAHSKVTKKIRCCEYGPSMGLILFLDINFAHSRLERLAWDKRSSLEGSFVSYEENKVF